MSDIKSAEDQKASRFLDLAVYTASTCIAFTLIFLVGRLLLPQNKPDDLASYSIMQTIGAGCALGLFMGYIQWADLYPDHLAYLDDLTTRIKTKLRALWAKLMVGPIAVYRYCTGSYLGAAIGAVPFGVASLFGVLYFIDKGEYPFPDWGYIIFGGTFMGVMLGLLRHSEKRLHLRWFWVPFHTMVSFVVGALLGEGFLWSVSFSYAGIKYGNAMAHWSDVRVGINWWGVWLKLGLGLLLAVSTFCEEVKKGSGARAQLVWSLKTARNGLLTIGEVGGEGWRLVRELLFAGLAGGAWWLAWHFGLACYQVDIAPWHIAATVAITLAAIPFIAFKAGMALEHLMRAGAAIVPAADPRPPITPRVTGTGTVWDADAAGGPRKGPTIDDLDF